jgi:hypothetical protein
MRFRLARWQQRSLIRLARNVVRHPAPPAGGDGGSSGPRLAQRVYGRPRTRRPCAPWPPSIGSYRGPGGDTLVVQDFGDLGEGLAFPEQRPDLRPPSIVPVVAPHVGQPNVLGDEVPAGRLEDRVVVGRGRPLLSWPSSGAGAARGRRDARRRRGSVIDAGSAASIGPTSLASVRHCLQWLDDRPLRVAALAGQPARVHLLPRRRSVEPSEDVAHLGFNHPDADQDSAAVSAFIPLSATGRATGVRDLAEGCRPGAPAGREGALAGLFEVV